MGQRLRAKNSKRIKDMATAYAKSPGPQTHKVARARSTKAKLKKAYRQA